MLQTVRNLKLPIVPDLMASNTTGTVDAANESVAIVGQVRLPDPSGGAKVISAAGGGGIYWRTGAITFANGGTTLRVGIMDVDLATGFGDTTFDVYADLVGGTDTITATSMMLTPMEVGTKTLAHGDLIDIQLLMTARAGADSVTPGLNGGSVSTVATARNFPYLVTNNSAKGTAAQLVAYIRFDDGTIGWIEGVSLPHATLTSVAFNSGSTPDEYCATFTPSFRFQIAGVSLPIASVAAGDNYEMVVYRDPLGTPAVLVTDVVDPEAHGASATVGATVSRAVAPITFEVGVTYGVSVRPTTANDINLAYFNLGSGFDALKAILPFPDCKVAARSNQTGAFTEVQAYHVPLVVFDVCGLETGAPGIGRGIGRGM